MRNTFPKNGRWLGREIAILALVAAGCVNSWAQIPALPELPALPPGTGTAQPTPAPAAEATPAGVEALPGAPDLPALPGLPTDTGSMVTPPPAPQLPQDRMSGGDVAKAQRRRDVEDALVGVREAFYKQDWEAAAAAIKQAEQVDPKAPQLQVYRNLLARKLAELAGQTGPALRTPRAGASTISEMGAALVPTPTATQAAVSPVPTEIKPTTESSTGGSGAGGAAQKKKKIMGALAILALGALGWFAFRFLSARKSAGTPQGPSAPPTYGLSGGGLSAGSDLNVPRTPAAPAPPLMFQDDEPGLMHDQATIVHDQATLMEDQATMMEGEPESLGGYRPKPLADDDPQDAESMARAIAKNLDQIKIKPPEQDQTFDLFLSGEQTNYGDAQTLAEATQQDVQISQGVFAAPPKPASAQPTASSAPIPAKGPEKASDTVSFEDLGIVFGGSEPAQPEPVKVETKPAPTAPVAPKSDSIQLAPEPVSPPQPKAPAANPSGAISLEELTLASPPKAMPAQAAPSKPISGDGAIDLQQVLFGKSPEAPTVEPSSPTTAAPESPAPAERSIELPSLDNLPPAPAAKTPSQEDTYGAYGDTFHSQDTVGLGSSTSTGLQGSDDARIEGTVGFSGGSKPPLEIDPALASTKTSTPQSPNTDNYYAASSSGGSQLDERSEKMFREQYDRAQKAMNDRNWRQAVHYLSIAAAIHPDNEQVREQLKEARTQKRKNEAGG